MAKKTTIALNILEKIGIGACILLGIGCVIGGTLAVSGLSMYGMLFLSKTLWMVLTAGIASGFVECDIFIQTFINSARNLFIQQYFKLELCKPPENSDLENNAKYIKLKKCKDAIKILAEQIEWLKKNQNKDNYAKDEAKLKIAKQRKYWLEKALVPLKKDWIQERIKADPSVPRYIKLYYLGLGASVCTGAGAGLAVASSLKTSLAFLFTHFGIALSTTVLSTTVFGLAAAAGAMYVAWTFSNICDMLQDAEFKQNCLDFLARFKRQENEKKRRHIGRCIGLVVLGFLLLGGNVIAVLATGGTWWRLVKHSAKIIPWLKNFANEVRDILVAISVLPNFISALVNGTESVTEFLKISPEKIKEQNKQDKEIRNQNENFFQRYNLFRAIIFGISLPAKIGTFLIHVISMGTTANHVKGINPRLTTGAVALNEVTQDGARIFADEDHHFDLIGNLIKLALLPFYLLSAVWDWGFSDLNTPELKRNNQTLVVDNQEEDINEPLSSNDKKKIPVKEKFFDSFNGAPKLSFKDACIKSFLGLKTLQKTPNISFGNGIIKFFGLKGIIEFFGFNVKKIPDNMPLLAKERFAELQPEREQKIKDKCDLLEEQIKDLDQNDKEQLAEKIVTLKNNCNPNSKITETTPFWAQKKRPKLNSFAGNRIAKQLEKLHVKVQALRCA